MKNSIFKMKGRSIVKRLMRLMLFLSCLYVISYIALSLMGSYMVTEFESGNKKAIWSARSCKRMVTFRGLHQVWLTEVGFVYLPLVYLDDLIWHPQKLVYSVQGDGFYVEDK